VPACTEAQIAALRQDGSVTTTILNGCMKKPPHQKAQRTVLSGGIGHILKDTRPALLPGCTPVLEDDDGATCFSNSTANERRILDAKEALRKVIFNALDQWLQGESQHLDRHRLWHQGRLSVDIKYQVFWASLPMVVDETEPPAASVPLTKTQKRRRRRQRKNVA